MRYTGLLQYRQVKCHYLKARNLEDSEDWLHKGRRLHYAKTSL